MERVQVSSSETTVLVRARRIPEDFKNKICCYCGCVIGWGDEADLKKVPAPFSAHYQCNENAWLVLMSQEEYESQVAAGRVTKSNLKPISINLFVENLIRSAQFLRSPWCKKIWFLFLKAINDDDL